MQKFDFLKSEISKRKNAVREYIQNSRHLSIFKPTHIYDAVLSYVNMGGKSLRPTVLLFSCGAVGGDESVALPAAAAIEIYHTWTLVHDDIIDNDDKRRGTPTVHAEFTQRAIDDLGWKKPEAAHYGMSIAILAGDIQQGWSLSLLSELSKKNKIDPAIALSLIDELATDIQTTLVEGETLDIQYSKTDFHAVPKELIIDMLWKKTGVLYKFASRAGAAIGLNDSNPQHEYTVALSEFCSQCGTAFQIQDDILGVIGDEEQLGKPVGSDIREGKRTLLTLKAYENANSNESEILKRVLGNPQASLSDIELVIDIMRKTGAIEYSAKIAREYVNNAFTSLKPLPQSEYKELLHLWAEYLIEREF